jgi:hypothetical protein
MPRDSSPSQFWYTIPVEENYRQVVELRPRVRDVQEELQNRVRAAPWISPSYEIIGRGAWPDWMAYWSPLLSHKALSNLEHFLSSNCEFLPWIQETRHNYTLLNVTTQIPKENWRCKESSIYGDVYAAADGITIHGIEIPDMFRLAGYKGKTFVSDRLAQCSVDLGLTGVLFVDPEIPELSLPFIRQPSKSKGFIGCESYHHSKRNTSTH